MVKRILVLIALCLMSLSAWAQRCAVLDFQIGAGVTEEEIEALNYVFRANFNVEGYRISPAERVKSVIEKNGYNPMDMTRQQMLKVGRELTCNMIVVGTINKFMGEYSVDVQAIDVSTGLICANEGATFEKGDYRKSMLTMATKLGESLADYDPLEGGTKAGATTGSSRKNSSKEDFVDLGLSVKWATCNLGASKPEEYGDYYAWGETTLKADYSWSTYKWCNGSYDTLTKYNVNSSYGRVDGIKQLQLSDDVARAKKGGSWRLPTRAEQDELRSCCSWEWTELNGVSGYKVTGPNGKSIFLPAAGRRDGTGLRFAGSIGYYWSSSLNTDYPYYAYYLYFSSSKVDWGNGNRYDGFSVRPVTE